MVDFDDSKVSGEITRPWYLVEIHLDERVLRYSSGGIADWGDKTFFADGLAENGVKVSADSLRLSLSNDDFEWTERAMNGGFHGKRLICWTAPADTQILSAVIGPGYVQPGYQMEPSPIIPKLVFDGDVSAVDDISQTIGIVANTQRLGGFPSLRITAPFANHTAMPGTKFTFNNVIYTVERR